MHLDAGLGYPFHADDYCYSNGELSEITEILSAASLLAPTITRCQFSSGPEGFWTEELSLNNETPVEPIVNKNSFFSISQTDGLLGVGPTRLEDSSFSTLGFGSSSVQSESSLSMPIGELALSATTELPLSYDTRFTGQITEQDLWYRPRANETIFGNGMHVQEFNLYENIKQIADCQLVLSMSGFEDEKTHLQGFNMTERAQGYSTNQCEFHVVSLQPRGQTPTRDVTTKFLSPNSHHRSLRASLGAHGWKSSPSLTKGRNYRTPYINDGHRYKTVRNGIQDVDRSRSRN